MKFDLFESVPTVMYFMSVFLCLTVCLFTFLRMLSLQL